MSEARNIHPIFMDCVGKENVRYAIAHPWVSGGYRYATDGRIIVRQRTDEPDSPEADGIKYPPAKNLGWDRAKYAADPLTLPDIPDEDIVKECPRCAGMGRRDCDMGHDHECDSCEGEGEHVETCWFEVGPVLLASPLVRIINRHGAKVFSGGTDKPVRLELELWGIEGIVMPGSRPDCNTKRIWTASRYCSAVQH